MPFLIVNNNSEERTLTIFEKRSQMLNFISCIIENYASDNEDKFSFVISQNKKDVVLICRSKKSFKKKMLEDLRNIQGIDYEDKSYIEILNEYNSMLNPSSRETLYFTLDDCDEMQHVLSEEIREIRNKTIKDLSHKYYINMFVKMYNVYKNTGDRYIDFEILIGNQLLSVKFVNNLYDVIELKI